MLGLELSPFSVFVRPTCSAMFHARATVSGSLAGLVVGVRRSARDAWQSAIDWITVESVVIHGVSLHIAPWQDLLHGSGGDLGWPLFGRVRIGQTLAVYLRSDFREVVELRAVLALGSPGPPRTGHAAAYRTIEGKRGGRQ